MPLMQYNSAGQLGIDPLFQAAAAAGRASASDPTAGILNYNAQLQLQANAERAKAIQLQQAMQLRQAQLSATPQPQAQYYGPQATQSPLAQSIRNAKQAIMSSVATEDLSGDQQAQLSGLVDDANIKPDDFSRVLTAINAPTKAAKAQQQRESAQQAKLDAQQKAQQSQQAAAQAVQQEREQQAGRMNQLAEKKQNLDQLRKVAEMSALGPGMDLEGKQLSDYLAQNYIHDQTDVQKVIAYRKAKADYEQTVGQMRGTQSIDQSQTPATVPQNSQKYQEGQILHSPSTGRTFKVVNGQLVELSNGPQQ